MQDGRGERLCTAYAPKVLWLIDIAEHQSAEFYSCAIEDLCSNRIVGYFTRDRTKAALAVDALNSVAARRGGCVVTSSVVHSDRGSRRSASLMRSGSVFRYAATANAAAGTIAFRVTASSGGSGRRERGEPYSRAAA